GASRTYYDVQLCVKAGADVIVLDGMQGGTAATQEVFIEHVGIPTLPAVRLAVDALQELDMHRKVQLIVSGGIRTGADVAKALARACGKSHVHNLEPEDLVALTVEAAAMARVPLAGTDWIPGVDGR